MTGVEQKLVSVCVPVYNAEEYVDQSLGPVVKQTCTILEIIVYNNG